MTFFMLNFCSFAIKKQDNVRWLTYQQSVILYPLRSDFIPLPQHFPSVFPNKGISSVFSNHGNYLDEFQLL